MPPEEDVRVPGPSSSGNPSHLHDTTTAHYRTAHETPRTAHSAFASTGSQTSYAATKKPSAEPSAPRTPAASERADPHLPSEDEDTPRDAALRAELRTLRTLNASLDELHSALESADRSMATLSGTVTGASTLLETWTRILAQTEHTARLVQDGSWRGGSSDAAEVEQAKARAAAARVAQQQRDQNRTRENERERERERELELRQRHPDGSAAGPRDPSRERPTGSSGVRGSRLTGPGTTARGSARGRTTRGSIYSASGRYTGGPSTATSTRSASGQSTDSVATSGRHISGAAASSNANAGMASTRTTRGSTSARRASGIGRVARART